MSLSEGESAVERSLRGRAAVLKSWAQTEDWTARTAPGRSAFDRRFEDQVDPERTLAPHERARRADMARKSYFADLARKSVAARRARQASASPAP